MSQEKTRCMRQSKEEIKFEESVFKESCGLQKDVDGTKGEKGNYTPTYNNVEREGVQLTTSSKEPLLKRQLEFGLHFLFLSFLVNLFCIILFAFQDYSLVNLLFKKKQVWDLICEW